MTRPAGARAPRAAPLGELDAWVDMGNSQGAGDSALLRMGYSAHESKGAHFPRVELSAHARRGSLLDPPFIRAK